MKIPVLELEVDKDGKLVNPSQEQAIFSSLMSEGAASLTDVIVFSHGWNNNLDEGRKLCDDFVGLLANEQQIQNGRNLLAICILWPSKKFEDSALIPGGAAAADSNPAADSALIQRLEEMKGLFADSQTAEQLDELKALVPSLNHDQQKQAAFVANLAAIMRPFIDRSQISDEEGRTQLSENTNGVAVLASLALPIAPRVNSRAGGSAGHFGSQLGGNPALHQDGSAAGVSDVLSGIKSGALRLLNYTTYAVMKDRAGKIGRDTINPLLQRLQQNLLSEAANKVVAFHFVGHSFGGRLVTAAVDGPHRLQVQTLLLLQAAYSHNGLSSDFDGLGSKGFFYSVVNEAKVSGPILITHSKHDSAVGLAYPIVSRLNGVAAASVGDLNDRFGGMGANGAQHVPQTANIAMLDAAGSYTFTLPAIRIYNLDADAIIASHGDVARAEVAHALAAAISIRSIESVGAPRIPTLVAGGTR